MEYFQGPTRFCYGTGMSQNTRKEKQELAIIAREIPSLWYRPQPLLPKHVIGKTVSTRLRDGKLIHGTVERFKNGYCEVRFWEPQDERSIHCASLDEIISIRYELEKGLDSTQA